ncbi:AMP-binding protein [Verminephrobacter sp. Larva24]|nr:AMP-binding protein [Verminephrobacter sp. Larva24]
MGCLARRGELPDPAAHGRWLHTGDIGVFDARGCLHFLGRAKEMLKVKGMSVFPSEVEALLGRHPEVLGCGVVGQADAEKGEIPIAFVRLRNASALIRRPAGATLSERCNA